MFQWGHDITVVETVVLVSTGDKVVMFQWGHDITVVETYYIEMTINVSCAGFNGATTLQSWKPSEAT